MKQISLKRLLYLLGVLLFAQMATAQVIKLEDFEHFNIDEYDGKADGKADWLTAAANMKNEFTLDKNKQLTKVTVVPCEGKTKQDIYIYRGKQLVSKHIQR